MISSLMLFGTLTFAFMGRKNARHFDERTQRYTTAWTPLSLPSLLWWNTVLLVISSATLEIARREHFREEAVMDEWLGLDRPTLRRALPLEAVTLVLSIGFIVGQSVAWRDLYHQGAFAPANASSHFYLALTGLHALHLIGGMIVLVWAIVAGLAGISLESRQIAVDITAWYWHAITVVWFGIFALLLYGQ
jgi:cytochrome c oxidase subunit 3